MARPLTQKQLLFTQEYLKDLNATAAYIRAGYGPNNAEKSGPALLGDSRVQLEVSKYLAKREEKSNVSVEKVLKDLKRIAECDLKDAYNEDGTLVNVRNMPEDIRKCISAIEVYEEKDREGNWIGTTKKIKFWDKNKALEMLGKYLKLFTEEVNVNVQSTVTIIQREEIVRIIKEIEDEC